MPTLLVPTSHPSLAQAIAAASPGDTIIIEAGYATVESVTVDKNNLTIDGQAGFGGTELTLAAGVTTLSLPGPMPFTVYGNAANNVVSSAATDVSVFGGDGSDIGQFEAGNSTLNAGEQGDTDLDRLVIDWSDSTGQVTAGYYSYGGHVSDAYGWFSNTQGGYYNGFSGVEEFNVTSGSGDDTSRLAI